MELEAQVVGVPEQVPEPAYQLQPVPETHVALLGLVAQAVGVPLHAAGM
jgi:hypothetical protein